MVSGAVAPLLIGKASADPRFADHPGLRLHGIESYVAVPLTRRNGEYFGTLCALDSDPTELNADALETFRLLASLIAFELEADEQQRRQETELADARHAATLREEFLGSVAHDLKNPLAGIRGYAQFLKRLVTRGGAAQADQLLTGLGHIERSTARMTASLDELMDVARAQMSRSLELQRKPTDLVALVRGVAAEHQEQASDVHRVHFTSATDAVIGAWDPSRLERVVQNLLANAIRYSPDGGEVTVTISQECSQGETWAVLTVADQGLGIPAVDLPHVFERFHRGVNVMGRIAGTGIGLFSVLQIVKQHGGVVTVDSRVGEGSTFTVRLPLQAEDTVEADSPV